MESLKKAKSSLSDQVYLHLRNKILKGDIKPGNSLLVLEISDSLKVSQAPVREALERLSQEGLIQKNRNRSAIVTEISPKEIEEIYEMRSLIEGYAVRKAMDSFTQKDIDQLYNIYEEMQQATKENNLILLNEKDMEFHTYIYQKCGNDQVLKVWNDIKLKIMRFIHVTNQIYFPSLGDVSKTHLSLIEVLQSGNKEEAEKCYLEHMKEVWWRMKEKNHNK